MAMTLVSTVTVGSGGAASIEFTGIAGTGKDLLLVVSARTSRAVTREALFIELNSSASGYSFKSLEGRGTSVLNDGGTGYSFVLLYGATGASATSSTFGSSAITISNYASSAAKSISADGSYETNGTDGGNNIVASSWSGTAAITSVKVSSNANFDQHSTASLYIIS